MFHPKPMPVPAAVRERFVREYPDVAADPALMRLVEHVAFTAPSDRTKTVLLPQQTLAAIEPDGQAALRAHRYSAEQLLKRMEQHFPGFSYYAHNSAQGLARAVKTTGLPAYLTDWDGPGEVFFSTGKAANRRNAKSVTDALEASVRHELDTAYEKTQAVVTYFQEKSSNKYHRLMAERFDDAWEVAEAVGGEYARESALRHLKVLRTYPYPVLRSVENSVRAYGMIEGYQTLHRPVRRTLFHGYTQLDLRSAQLAIVARLWNVTGLQAFLAAGNSIWQHLADVYGTEITEGFKNVLKPALYAATFGASTATIRGIITTEGAGAYDPAPFLSDILIQELLEARDRRMQHLLNDVRTISIGQHQDLRITEENIRTVLAMEAQLLELELLYPVFELASASEGKPAFDILVYLFDGVIIDIAPNRNPDSVIARIRDAVQQRADELGVMTALEFERL